MRVCAEVGARGNDERGDYRPPQGKGGWRSADRRRKAAALLTVPWRRGVNRAGRLKRHSPPATSGADRQNRAGEREDLNSEATAWMNVAGPIV